MGVRKINNKRTERKRGFDYRRQVQSAKSNPTNAKCHRHRAGPCSHSKSLLGRHLPTHVGGSGAQCRTHRHGEIPSQERFRSRNLSSLMSAALGVGGVGFLRFKVGRMLAAADTFQFATRHSRHEQHRRTCTLGNFGRSSTISGTWSNLVQRRR